MRAWIRQAALFATFAVGCGSTADSAGGFASPRALPPGDQIPSANGSASGGNAGASTTAGGGAPGRTMLPPEMKTESDYQSPVATGQFVWTANPTSGRVAYIDAKSFSVQTVQAGDGPTYLAAVPNPNGTGETAIVLNVRSHDATLLRRDTSTGVPTATRYPSTREANSWAISPKGRWAIAWTDAAKVQSADPTQGFQDMAVLDVGPPAGTPPRSPTTLAVGYRPSQLAFSLDEKRAFVVTQDGISVLDLSGSQPALTQNFALSAPVDNGLAVPDSSAPDSSSADSSSADSSSADSGAIEAAADAPIPETSTGDGAAPEAAMIDDAGTEGSTMGNAVGPPLGGMPDVSFTTNAAYALVRQSGVSAITVVSLTDGSATTVALPAAPTDLAMAPDGTFAVAVLRDLSSVAVLPLPGIASSPSSFTITEIPGETIGRAVVAEDLTTKQSSVLLFTTVVAADSLTVLTLQPTPSFRTLALHAPVLAVFPTRDAENAIVLHNVTATSGSAVKGAFSIVPIAKSLPAKIVSLTAPPTAVALAPSGDRALVSVSDNTAIFGAELAIMPSLEVLEYTLASPPTAVGIAEAAGMGFVAQNYRDGRITFIDLADGDAGAARTITGFELSARVVQGDGSAP
jgi:hypothetical protein